MRHPPMSLDRLSVAEAEALVEAKLGVTSRAAHSRFVGGLMRRLAPEFAADADLWMAIGLVHDLDYVAVDEAREAGVQSRRDPASVAPGRADDRAGRTAAQAACASRHDRLKGRASTTGRFARVEHLRPDHCAGRRAPVAQLDRAPDYESGGRGFESFPARHP